MVVIKANITPGDELQTRRSWKVIAGSSQPPPRKTTIFFDQKGSLTQARSRLQAPLLAPLRGPQALDPPVPASASWQRRPRPQPPLPAFHCELNWATSSSAANSKQRGVTHRAPRGRGLSPW